MRLHRFLHRPPSAAGVLATGAFLAAVLATAGCSGAITSPNTGAAPTNGAGSAGNAGAARSAPRPGVVPTICNVGTLSVALGPAQGAAGSSYFPLDFTNTGSRPCVIQGFPGVSYLANDRATQVGVAAVRDGPRTGPVTLRPGAVASAALAMVQVRNFTSSVCRPTPVSGLKVYPPTDSTWVFVPLSPGNEACAGNPPTRQLRITSVREGTVP